MEEAEPADRLRHVAGVHGRDEVSVLKAAEEVRSAYKISNKSIDEKKIIIKRISK